MTRAILLISEIAIPLRRGRGASVIGFCAHAGPELRSVEDLLADERCCVYKNQQICKQMTVSIRAIV